MKQSRKIDKIFYHLSDSFATVKNLIGKIYHSFSLKLSLIRVYYVTPLALCSDRVKFSSNTEAQRGSEETGERKKTGITPPQEARNIELSDFDKKYYDLMVKGLIDPYTYEQSRLLILSTEKDSCSLVV